MAISLFWRLIIGYAAILLLTIGASLYSIIQLGALSKSAQVAIDTDYRVIADQETLTDVFLSEVRYGGKYLLTQSPATYDQFVQFKSDFLHYLRGLKAIEMPAPVVNQLSHIEQLHHSYHDLFEREVCYIKARQPYAQSRYQQEREKILDNTLRELARLKEQLQKNAHDKLEEMGGSARTARNIAIGTTLILLVLGTALSLKISTTITSSLAKLKQRIQNEGSESEPRPSVSSIPEIQELSVVLAQRINWLNEAAETNANLILDVTEQLAARLIAQKTRIRDLGAPSQTTTVQSNQAPVAELVADTDRLVQYCAELNATAAAQTEVRKLERRAAQAFNPTPALAASNRRNPSTWSHSLAATLRATAGFATRCVNMLVLLARHFGLHKLIINKQRN